MIARTFATAVLAASVGLAPASRVSADTGSFVAGAVVGGIAGHLITKDAQKRKAAQSSGSSSSGKSGGTRLPATQDGRLTQTSLNYFGFNAGNVDGQLGRQSRAAIASYQAYMGYPASGQMSAFEQDILYTAYNRALSGGPAVSQKIATSPQGTRVLLTDIRDEMSGVKPAAQAPLTAASSPGTAATALPNFGSTTAQPSLASHCNTVSLITNSNGGFTTLATMSDPAFAMSEQFCLARTYAIADSDAQIAKTQGFTSQQIDEQCGNIGPAMQPYVNELSSMSPGDLTREVQIFVLDTGLEQDSLRNSARICLGVGYRKDDLPVALGSALILYALGQRAYGELVGHHLAEGFNTSADRDRAIEWYTAALDAVDSGQQPVFAPGQPERTQLLREATVKMGRSSSLAVPQMQSASALPVIPISE